MSNPKSDLMLTEDLLNDLIRIDTLEIMYPVQGGGAKKYTLSSSTPPYRPNREVPPPPPPRNDPKQSPPRLKLDPKIFYALECNPSLYKALKKTVSKSPPTPKKKGLPSNLQVLPLNLKRVFCTSLLSLWPPPPILGRGWSMPDEISLRVFVLFILTVDQIICSLYWTLSFLSLTLVFMLPVYVKFATHPNFNVYYWTLS